MTNNANEPTNGLGSADEDPSDAEAAAAERSASEVDTEEVAEHEDEMNRRGANAKGEGKIVP